MLHCRPSPSSVCCFTPFTSYCKNVITFSVSAFLSHFIQITYDLEITMTAYSILLLTSIKVAFNSTTIQSHSWMTLTRLCWRRKRLFVGGLSDDKYKKSPACCPQWTSLWEGGDALRTQLKCRMSLSLLIKFGNEEIPVRCTVHTAKWLQFWNQCLSAVLRHLFASKRRPYFKTRKWSLKEQNEVQQHVTSLDGPEHCKLLNTLRSVTLATIFLMIFNLSQSHTNWKIWPQFLYLVLYDMANYRLISTSKCSLKFIIDQLSWDHLQRPRCPHLSTYRLHATETYYSNLLPNRHREVLHSIPGYVVCN